MLVSTTSRAIQLSMRLASFSDFKQRVEQRLANEPMPHVADERLDRYICAVDGSTVRYRWRPALAEGSNTSIALCAGWTCHPSMYTPIIPFLNERHALITIENRGHWKSTLGRSSADTYISDLAKDLNAVMECHGVGKVLIVGHSMWGFAALHFYSMFPEKVAGIILMCTPLGQPLETWFLGDSSSVTAVVTALSRLLETGSPFIDTVKRHLLASSMVAKQVGKLAASKTTSLGFTEHFDRFYFHFMRTNSRATAICFNAMLREEPVLERLASVSVPVLVLAGEKDQMVLSDFWLDTKPRLPVNVRLHVMKDIGHLPPLEFPSITSMLINSFVVECDF